MKDVFFHSIGYSFTQLLFLSSKSLSVNFLIVCPCLEGTSLKPQAYMNIFSQYFRSYHLSLWVFWYILRWLFLNEKKPILTFTCVTSFLSTIHWKVSAIFILDIFVKNKLAVNSRVYFSVLYSVPLVCVSFCTQVLWLPRDSGVCYLKSRIFILIAFMLSIRLLWISFVFPCELWNCCFWFCEECD